MIIRLSKTGKLMRIYEPCVHIVRRVKQVRNRHDKTDEGFKKTSYYCNKLNRTIKKSYCKGCVFFKELELQIK